jgi:hypothetical protein
MESERFDRIIETWGARAPRRRALRELAGLAVAGITGRMDAAESDARRKHGLKVGHACNPSRPKQCRSGVCGCNGPTLCGCRTRHCAATGQPCGPAGNVGCCEGVCSAADGLCIAPG